jgi:SagB-type dehydrogenase family enzyme
MSGRVQTIGSTSWIYGPAGPAIDDPAELYHEASKIYPSTAARDTRGLRLLEARRELQHSVGRSVRRFPQLPAVHVPEPAPLRLELGAAIRGRASRRRFADGPIAFAELSALLQAAYGVTHAVEADEAGRGLPLRSVPSGGALYPLELYVAATRVAQLESGLYHYDPLRSVLERARTGLTEAELEPLSPYPELVAPTAAVLFVTALFWRTRFKYALRGYRFALLEAGHLGQNVLLAATALDLAAVPVGGVYDRRVEDFLAVDGVDESLVYALSVGRATG